MKTIAVEIDRFPMIVIRLDETLTRSMNRAARLAGELLAQDQVRRDVASSDPDMLGLCERGASRLDTLGKTMASRLTVDPCYLGDAHNMTCLLASCQRLKPRDKKDLFMILEFLAAIFPVWVKAGSLPFWEEIHADRQTQETVRKIYEDFCQKLPNDEGCRKIKLGDALVLREGLQLKPHPTILRLWEELNKVTATHRNALRLLLRKSR